MFGSNGSPDSSLRTRCLTIDEVSIGQGWLNIGKDEVLKQWTLDKWKFQWGQDWLCQTRLKSQRSEIYESENIDGSRLTWSYVSGYPSRLRSTKY